MFVSDDQNSLLTVCPKARRDSRASASRYPFIRAAQNATQKYPKARAQLASPADVTDPATLKDHHRFTRRTSVLNAAPSI